MRDIILSTDGYRPKTSDVVVKVDVDGELYECKRPKNTLGAMLDRLRQRAEDEDLSAHSDLVSQTLAAILVHTEDVEYFYERALDPEDWVELEFILHLVDIVSGAYADEDDKQAAPSAKARRVRPPADRPAPARKKSAAKKTAKKTVAKRPAKKSAPAAAGE